MYVQSALKHKWGNICGLKSLGESCRKEVTFGMDFGKMNVFQRGDPPLRWFLVSQQGL